MKKKDTKHKYNVGDKVYIVDYSTINGVKGKPFAGIVNKVGRKYFYVKADYITGRFCIEDNMHDGDGFSRYSLFPSMQAFKDHVDYIKLMGKLRHAFDYWSDIYADLEQLRQIAKILGIKEDDDEN